MQISFNEITPGDYPYMREILYDAIFVPPGEKAYDPSIIDLPEISKYIESWSADKDFGIIISWDGKMAGAIWSRLFSIENKGYGFVNTETPELTMAIKEPYRNRGLGSLLMQQFLQMAKDRGHKSISLSVDKRNRAYSFYKKTGFTIVEETETSYTMKILLNEQLQFASY